MDPKLETSDRESQEVASLVVTADVGLELWNCTRIPWKKLRQDDGVEGKGTGVMGLGRLLLTSIHFFVQKPSSKAFLSSDVDDKV